MILDLLDADKIKESTDADHDAFVVRPVCERREVQQAICSC